MSQQELLYTDDDLNDLLAHAAKDEVDLNSWPKMLADLIEVTLAELNDYGLHQDEAWRIAKRLITRQAHYFGGGMMYLPRNEKLKKALRDANLYHDFNGHNQRDLMKKYKLTQQAVYQICAEQRKLFVKKSQHELF